MITTIKINKDKKHQMTIPIEAWNMLKLQEGDHLQIKMNRVGSDKYMISTVHIPPNNRYRHHITIPTELWHGLKLNEGIFVQIDVTKVVVK